VEIKPSDIVLDIGSGRGILAENLLRILGDMGKLELIELDKELFAFLFSKFSSDKNVRVHNVNFIEYQLPQEPFKVFSNIPFNYTADILNKVLDYRGCLECVYMVMQKEALESWGGSQTYPKKGESLKSLYTYPFYKVSEIYKFQKSDFSPLWFVLDLGFRSGYNYVKCILYKCIIS